MNEGNLYRESLAERPEFEGSIRSPDRLPLGTPFSAQNINRRQQFPGLGVQSRPSVLDVQPRPRQLITSMTSH